MPRAHPPEFRLRAVELARERAKPIAEIARDLGISESCLRNWIAKSDIEEGRREGVTAADRAETVALRRKVRTLEMENEVLRRAAAYFARDSIQPK
jgi:transposase-like protein